MTSTLVVSFRLSFNGKIGRNIKFSNGNISLHANTPDDGMRLAGFAAAKSMLISGKSLNNAHIIQVELVTVRLYLEIIKNKISGKFNHNRSPNFMWVVPTIGVVKINLLHRRDNSSRTGSLLSFLYGTSLSR